MSESDESKRRPASGGWVRGVGVAALIAAGAGVNLTRWYSPNGTSITVPTDTNSAEDALYKLVSLRVRYSLEQNPQRQMDMQGGISDFIVAMTPRPEEGQEPIKPIVMETLRRETKALKGKLEAGDESATEALWEIYQVVPWTDGAKCTDKASLMAVSGGLDMARRFALSALETLDQAIFNPPAHRERM